MQNTSSSSTANTNAPVAIIPRMGGKRASCGCVAPEAINLETSMGKAWKQCMVVMFWSKPSPSRFRPIYQRYSVLSLFELGYVMIVISILTVPVLPRGSNVMNLFITLVSIAYWVSFFIWG